MGASWENRLRRTPDSCCPNTRFFFTSTHNRRWCEAMSRPTTTQLIEQGNYLQPDFDPSTLTIPHIIGILAYHQIKYPSQANKAALIKIFNNEIKANHAVLLRQRIIKQEISASDNGIIDGVTGIPINPQQVSCSDSSVKFVDWLNTYVDHATATP